MRWAGPGLLTALWPTSATVLREASTLAGATCLLLRCRPGGAFVSHPEVSVSRLAAVSALCVASRALLYTFDHADNSADRSRARFHAGRRRRRSGASQRLLRLDGDHHGRTRADRRRVHGLPRQRLSAHPQRTRPALGRLHLEPGAD